MRLRELLVAIKIKVETKAAKEVDKVLGQITKHAKQAERALDSAAKAGGKLDKNLRQTGKSSKAASKGLDAFARSAKKAEDAADRAGKAADKAGDKIEKAGKKGNKGGKFKVPEMSGAQGFVKGAAVAGGAAILAGGGFAAAIAGERESLREQLKNIEGDEAKAAETFGRIERLAAKTPFAIEEIATGVIKLKAAGLQASDEAMTAYGDLASTMGKGVDEFVEATKDAVTGEFERLKEFNIKASKSGDIVSFTFKGQTTAVQNNAQAIEEYLISIGKMPGVAGAMAGQMKTLGGVFSNFKDSIFSAIDQSMQSSGALEEMKGLITDLVGPGEDAAGVFGTFLADAIRDVRKWIKSLTAEDIHEWLERAAEFADTTIEAILGLSRAILEVIDVIADFIEGIEGGDAAVQVLLLSLGAMALVGGGLPGIFAAVGVGAMAMAMKFGDSTDKIIADVERLKRAGVLKALQGKDGPMSEEQGTEVEGYDPTKVTSVGAEFVEKAQEANRKGLGEEFFRSAEDQLVDLGVEEAVDPNDIEARTKRFQARGGRSAEEVLATRAGFDTRVGVNKEAAKFLDALDAKKAKDLERFKENARKRGVDDNALETILTARETELDDRRQKAAQTFTKTIRTSGDFDKATKAALKELDDKKKKGRGGGKEFFDFDKQVKDAARKQAEKFAAEELQRLISTGLDPDDALKKAKDAGLERAKELEAKFRKAGKIMEDGGKDLLAALGLKGPGSILENRPAPQSLVIQTNISVKVADTIDVTVTMPEGSTLGQTKEAVGNEVGKAIDESAAKKLVAIYDDATALRWEQLAKARGGGRVPKSSKQRGKAP